MREQTQGNRIVKSSTRRVLLATLLTLAPLSLGQLASAETVSNASATALGVAQNRDGRLEAFTLQEDGTISHAWQTKSGVNQWSGWITLGGSMSSTPTVTRNRGGSLEAFAVGTDSTLQHAWQTTSGNPVWTAWSSLGNSSADLVDATATTEADGRMEVFALDVNGDVWYRTQNPDPFWGPWKFLGGGFVSKPAVGRNKDGSLQVFEVGSGNHHLWWTAQDKANGNWSNTWYTAPGRELITDPSVARNKDGRLEVFASARNVGLVHIWQEKANDYRMSDWNDFGDTAAGPPSPRARPTAAW